ncbi:hypothetical protein JHK85_019278 [Glycine max]|nr:hypothetical protein JHK85_019278 [Glycine max]
MDHHEDESNSKQVDEERAAALAEGLPAPTLCSSGDVRDLNIEYFKYAHQHRITEGQNKVVITYRMWARLMSSTNQPSFTIAKTISEEKREEEANGHVPKQLDLLLKGLGFTQKKADSHVRWPLLNTVLVLWRHEAARGKVAEALSMGKSIGSCIDIIENSINAIELIRDNSLQMLSNSCLEGELTNDDGTKCVYPQDVCTLNHECPNPKSLL